MEILLAYTIKTTALLSLIWLFYAMTLCRHTLYAANRGYLIIGITLAFLLPCISFPQFAAGSPIIQLTATQLSEWDLLIFTELFAQAQPVERIASLSVASVVIWSIGCGIVLFFGLFCIRLSSFFRLKRRAKRQILFGVQVFTVQEQINPFSFFGHIFLNPNIHNKTEIAEIVAHERFHIKHKHTIDLILAEAVVMIFWFNPFAWLLRKAIRQNLEYLADRHVLKSGFDTLQYQYILVRNSISGTPGLSIAHNFTFSNLKKRIIMMNKKRTPYTAMVKYLLLVPLIAFAWIGVHAGEITRKIDVMTTPLVTQDTVKVFGRDELNQIDPSTIKSMTVLKGKDATDRYGEDASNGAIIIELKTGEVSVYLIQDNVPKSDDNQIFRVVASDNKPLKNTANNMNGLLVDTQGINPLYIIDGEEIDDISNLSPDRIESISVLKGQAAIKDYGEKGKNGVVLITTKILP